MPRGARPPELALPGRPADAGEGVKGDCGVVAAVAGDSPVGSSASVDEIVEDGRRAASEREAGGLPADDGELVKAVDWGEGSGKTQRRSRTRLCCNVIAAQESAS